MNEQYASMMRSALYDINGEISPEGIQELYDWGVMTDDPEWLDTVSHLDEEYRRDPF